MKVSTQSRLVRADARGRLSLGRPHAEFLLSEQPDGALVVEPTALVSSLEAALLANDDIQHSMAMAHQGEGLVRRLHGRRDVTTE